MAIGGRWRRCHVGRVGGVSALVLGSDTERELFLQSVRRSRLQPPEAVRLAAIDLARFNSNEKKKKKFFRLIKQMIWGGKTAADIKGFAKIPRPFILPANYP